jgi:hypothetical protein
MTAGYYEKPGGANLPPELVTAANRLRGINGLTNKIVIVPSAMHEAYTNMTYISLSGDYLSMAMEGNYHGYPEKRLREDLDFVIQHEIGHLNIHPGVAGGGWKEEIESMPVEGNKKGQWSNVLSDVIVNYNAANGTQLTIGGKEKLAEVARMSKAMWNAYGGGFRSCFDGSAKNMGCIKHRELLDAGKLVDNRYNNGRYDPHAAGNPYLAAQDTPEFQKLLGHGRAPQLYPAVAHCVANKMPVGTDMGPGMGQSRTVQDYPDNWKQVKLLASLDIEYSPNADKWLGYNPTPGSCPLTGGSTEKVGSIGAGEYQVVATRTYDGIENPKNVRPIEFFKLRNGSKDIWVPAHYCISKCPHCGEPAPSQFQLGMGYKPDIAGMVGRGDIPQDIIAQIEKSKLYNVLLCNLNAGLYATSQEGFDGKTGRDAGIAFLNACAWDRHLCMIGR